jgi:hypothetical protein
MRPMVLAAKRWKAQLHHQTCGQKLSHGGLRRALAAVVHGLLEG